MAETKSEADETRKAKLAKTNKKATDKTQELIAKYPELTHRLTTVKGNVLAITADLAKSYESKLRRAKDDKKVGKSTLWCQVAKIEAIGAGR